MDHADPLATLRPLIRTRQYREFTAESVSDAEIHALTEVARWSGSSQNQQPWRFVVVRDRATLEAVTEAGLPLTGALRTAAAAIAIAVLADPARAVSHAYDEGRAAERLLIAATMLGLGAGITWIRPEAGDAVRHALGIPEDRRVRTVVALGHPTEAARRPRSAPGTARLPREQVVFEDRWPSQ